MSVNTIPINQVKHRKEKNTEASSNEYSVLTGHRGKQLNTFVN